MLDPWIIEQIRRREQEERERPRLELPLTEGPDPWPVPGEEPVSGEHDPGQERGVIIIGI